MANYAYFNMPSELWVLIGFYIVFFAILILGGIVNYILRGIAIYKMSKNRGIPNGGLGFVPYANNYQLGVVAGEIEIGNKKVRRTGLWLLLAPIIFGVIVIVMYLVLVFTMVFSAFSSPTAMESALLGFFIGFIVFFLIVFIGSIIVKMFRVMALHKIFSRYSVGQKPVFYLFLALFVPFGEAITLFIHRNRPVLLAQQDTIISPQISEEF